MDILKAQAEIAAPTSTDKCKIQRWLDGIDPDTPDLADLVAWINTKRPQPGEPLPPHYRPLKWVERLVYKLDLDTTYMAIGDHRSNRCRCSR